MPDEGAGAVLAVAVVLFAGGWAADVMSRPPVIVGFAVACLAAAAVWRAVSRRR